MRKRKQPRTRSSTGIRFLACRRYVAVAFAAVFVCFSVGVLGAAPPKVGVAAAVHGAVEILCADGTTATIKSGDFVFLGDKVIAGADAGLQVLLLDETVFTVGANSEIVIDRFVYDPERSTGEVSASIAKGVFRFVTGRVAAEKPSNMEVKVPAGTIGVRGTIVAGRIDGQSTELALLGPGDESNTRETVGRIEVSNDQGTVVVSRSGYGTTISPGGSPTEPARMPAATMTSLTGLAATSSRSAGAAAGNPDAAPAAATTVAVSQSAEAFTGQTVASAIQSVAATREAAAGGRQATDNATESTQTSSVEDGITQISELPTSGSFHYTQDNLSTSKGGSYSISVDLDLGNRAFGGGNSTISGTSGDANLQDFSFSILSKSLDSFTSAEFEDNPANANCTGAHNCSATLTMKLINSGGSVAANMKHQFVLTNDNTTETENGSGTTSISSGLTN